MLATLKYIWVFSWSFLSLLIERLWNGFWPAFSVVLLFAAVSFLNIPFLFGLTGHLVILALFALAFVVALWRFGLPYRFPRRDDVDRHIESASALPHRPMETLRDKPAGNTSHEAWLLWEKHLEQTRAQARKIRIYPPRFDADRHDRYALRHAAILLFVVGLVIARHDALPRLAETLQPDIAKGFQTANAAMDIWIEPPGYTGATPVFLSSSKNSVPTATDKDGISIPENSILKLRLAGYSFGPHVAMDGDRIPLAETSKGNYTAEFSLHQSGSLSVRPLFGMNRSWALNVMPDKPPAIKTVMTEKTARGAMKISYQASDDYGIQKITATVSSADTTENASFDISPPSGPSTGQAILTHSEDLTSSTLAGSSVILTLRAEDNAGHITTSEPVTVFLPERVFTNPTASALILERKRLLYFNNPITRRISAANIVNIANHPAYYKGDGLVFLGLGMAARRLSYDGSDEAVASTAKLLWDLALRVEDGGLSMASRDLAEALQKFTAALDDKNVSQAELQRLMDDVQKKMQEYVQNLAAEMQQRLQQGQDMHTMSPELAEKFAKHIDVNKMMQQMRDLAQGGNREQMRKMAEDLKNSVENLDLNKLDQMQKAQQQAMQSLEEMQKLIESQQSLLDKTGKMDKDADTAPAAKEQEDLRRKLGEIVRKLGEAMPDLPDNLPKADQAMKSSQKNLSEGHPKESAPHQKEALDQLQQGMDSTVQQMAEGMQQMMMSFGMGGSSGKYGSKYDPLGRDQGPVSDGDVKLPDEQERRRVQQIIKELRDRSNDYQRPKVERDYIDRLLDSFN